MRDAGEPAVDFALAADREKLGVGGAGVQQLGDIGAVHRVVVVNLEIVPVREVDSRHREHRAGDQRIAVGADDPQIAQLRHRHRHRAKPLGMGCFVRADLLVRGGAGGFVQIAGGKLEGLEHLLRMFVHDRKIAAQTVARLVEMLMVRNRRGGGIQHDRQHDRAEQQDAQRPGGAPRRLGRRVQQAGPVGQTTNELTHRREGNRPQRGGSPDVTLNRPRTQSNDEEMSPRC